MIFTVLNGIIMAAAKGESLLLNANDIPTVLYISAME